MACQSACMHGTTTWMHFLRSTGGLWLQQPRINVYLPLKSPIFISSFDDYRIPPPTPLVTAPKDEDHCPNPRPYVQPISPPYLFPSMLHQICFGIQGHFFCTVPVLCRNVELKIRKWTIWEIEIAMQFGMEIKVEISLFENRNVNVRLMN